MPSNISLISSGVFASARIVRVTFCASRFIAPFMSLATCSSMCHSGFHASSGLFSIQVAKPSFNQMLFHHFIVTMSPNHWCAISCATTDATSAFALTGAFFSSTSMSDSR